MALVYFMEIWIFFLNQNYFTHQSAQSADNQNGIIIIKFSEKYTLAGCKIDHWYVHEGTCNIFTSLFLIRILKIINKLPIHYSFESCDVIACWVLKCNVNRIICKWKTDYFVMNFDFVVMNGY